MTQPFEYTIKKHKSAKNLKIKIDSKGSDIVVCPPYIPNFVISQFVNKHQDWVIKHKNSRNFEPKFNTKEEVYIFGRKYLKKL